jgi:hypothetical protein
MIKTDREPVNLIQCEQKNFGHWSFGHLVLPFDLAQGGELAEPFRKSDFDIHQNTVFEIRSKDLWT